MVKQFLKFINKSPYRVRLKQLAIDVKHGTLTQYSIVPIRGQKDLFRIRVGTVRVIIRKGNVGYTIVKILGRGDVYKAL